MSETKNTPNSPRWRLLGIIIGAVGASICCIGPLLLLTLGIGGAWVSNLTALEAYRPYFIGITLLFLGIAFYQVYKPQKQKCSPGSECEVSPSRKKEKIFLWMISIVSAGLIAFPYLFPKAVSAAKKSRVSAQLPSASVAVLKLNNLSCPSCAVSVEHALEQEEGVLNVSVSFEESKAIVNYDPALVQPEELIQRTKEAGFPSSLETIKKKED